MKHHNTVKRRILRLVLDLVYAAALAVISLVSLLQPAHADDLKTPIVPAAVQVPAGNKVFFVRTLSALRTMSLRALV